MQYLRLGGYKSFRSYNREREIPKLGCLPRSVCTFDLVLLLEQASYRTGLGTVCDEADTGGQSGVEACSAGQTSAWPAAVAFALGVLLALPWKSGLVSDRRGGSDCPCRQQIPESQVGANESGPPRGPRGIPVRMGAGVDPDFEGWNGEAEQKDLAKFSMAWRCPSPNCWSFHPHTVP